MFLKAGSFSAYVYCSLLQHLLHVFGQTLPNQLPYLQNRARLEHIDQPSLHSPTAKRNNLIFYCLLQTELYLKVSIIWPLVFTYGMHLCCSLMIHICNQSNVCCNRWASVQLLPLSICGTWILFPLHKFECMFHSYSTIPTWPLL